MIKCYVLAATVLGCLGSSADATIFVVDNYRSRADNPFWNNPALGTVYLDDFEPPNSPGFPGNVLITPHATGWNGSIVSSPFRGVEEDSAASDPDEGLGYYWTDSVIIGDTLKDPPGIHFDFTPDADGRFPDYCGAVMLGKYDSANTGQLFNSIFVYDKDGNEVTGGLWQIPKPLLSDPVPENPADYFSHFEGIYVPGGISRIQFRDFIEIDHLTYGYSVPEPSGWALASTGLLVQLRRRRNSSTAAALDAKR